MKMLRRRLGLLLAVTLTCAGTGPLALAQDQPPDAIQGDNDESSGMVVRIGRLESQIRALTGQIEQLQYQNKRLEDNLRKMQQDVDFRFQDLQGHGAPAAAPTATRPGPQKRSDADAGAPADQAAAVSLPPDPAAAAPVPLKPTRSAGDAFDPDADPTAPGAPRTLGTTAPSAPLAARTPRQVATAEDSHAPLDLMRRPATPDQPPATAGGDTPSIIAAPAAVPRDPPNPNAVASLVPGGTREEYDADLGLYKQGQFDGAATGFQAFATKYPKDRLVPDAVYLAGESFAKLGRHREAAEQFLKVSTDYGKSARAPDALLRLGMSLNALGAKEQACATYQEVTRRYPAASADVRSAVDRELKRARCVGSG